MATHAVLASTRIPINTWLPINSKTSGSFPAQCFSKKLEVLEFSGLRSSGCDTYAKNAVELTFFDVVASQLTPKAIASTPANGETVAKLKLAINGIRKIRDAGTGARTHLLILMFTKTLTDFRQYCNPFGTNETSTFTSRDQSVPLKQRLNHSNEKDPNRFLTIVVGA